MSPEFKQGDKVSWSVRALMGGTRRESGVVQRVGLERYGHDDVMTVLTPRGELAEIRSSEARLVKRGEDR